MLVAPDRSGAPSDATPDRDDRVVMRNLDWWQYEAMLAIRGDSAGVRMAYLEGDLEIMSPGRIHEFVKTAIARLLEAYAEETGIYFNGHGSLTMTNPARRRGAEPDECYVVGGPKEQPDLAIEVILTSGGLDKRRIYAGLGVHELWGWRDGTIEVLIPRGDEYQKVSASELLPELDLVHLASFIQRDDQTAAVREFRRGLGDRQ
jgi:Uma2 family endonuclease